MMTTFQLLEVLANSCCNPANIKDLLANQSEEIKTLFAQNDSAGLKKHLANGKVYFADAIATSQIFCQLTSMRFEKH